MSDKLISMMNRVIMDAPKRTGQYAKNLGTSTYYGYGKVFQGLMPNVTRMADVNRQTAIDIVNVIKNPMRIGSALNNSIDSSNVLKQSDKILKNAMDDLRSGKFYDPKRDRTEEGMKTAALMDNFGGFDMNGFDDEGGYSEPVSSDADAISSTIEGATKIQEDNADTRFKLQIESDIGNTEAIIRNDQAIAKQDLKMQLKQHANTMGIMSSSISLQAAQLEFMNTQTIQYYQIVQDMSGVVSENLPKISNTLTEIRDLLKSQGGGNGSGSPSSMRSTMSKSKAEEESPFERGSFSIAKYGKNVMKRGDSKFGVSNTLSMLLFGQTPEEFMELFKSNPLEDIWTMGLKSMIPKLTQTVMQSLDKSMSAFFPALLLKFNKMGDDDSLKGLFGKIFGYEMTGRTNIDTQYNMEGNIGFDAVAHKTLVDVIPYRLGQLVSILSGERESIFDHSSGKYVDRIDTAVQKKKQANDMTGGMSGTMSKINDMKRSFIFNDNKDEDLFNNDLQTMMNSIVKGQKLYNPKSSYEASGISLKGGKKTYNLISGMMQALSRNELMSMNKEIFESVQSKDESIVRQNEEMHRSGLMSLFAGGSQKESDLVGRLSNNITRDEQMKIFEDAGMLPSASNPLSKSSMTGLLSDILRQLQMGIIVYSKDISSADVGDIGSHLNRTANWNFTKYIKDVEIAARKEDERKQKSLTDERNYSQNENDIGLGKRAHVSLTGPAMSADFAKSVSLKNMEDLKNLREAAELKSKEENPVFRFFNSFKFGKKLISAREKTTDFTNDPFSFITRAMQMVDKKIYATIYGSEGDESDSELPWSKKGDKKSFLNKMFETTKFQFLNFRKFLTEDILDPLYEKLLGEKGIFTKLGDKLNPMKQRALNFGIDKTKQMGNYLLGEWEDDYEADPTRYLADGTPVYAQKRSGGLLSSVANTTRNKFNSVKSSLGNHSSNMWNSAKGAMFGTGEMKRKMKGDQEYYEEDNGMIGGAKSMISDVKKNISEFMFGPKDGVYDQKTGKMLPTRSRQMWDTMTKEFDGFLPKGVVGAGAGVGAYLGAGLLTGLFLPGGPIMAAVIGSTASFIGHSDKLKEYLFGSEDKEGVIDKEIVDGFKKFAPKIAMGAGIGAMIKNFGILGTAALPGGPITGAFIGGIVGMTVASTSLKKALFGEGVDEEGHFTEDYKKFMMDKAATLLPAGLAGFGVGHLIANFGILGAIPGMQFLALGTTLAALVGADDIKHLFFGEKDKDGKVVNRGVFDKMVDFGKANVFDPFINGINNAGNNIQVWFKDAITNPLAEAMGPMKEEFRRSTKYIKEAFGNFGGWMKSGMDSVFEKSFGAPLEDLLKKYVTEPIKNLFSSIMTFIGKMLGGLISAPFKALNGMAKGFDKKHKRDDFKSSLLDGFAQLIAPAESGGIDGVMTNIRKLNTEFEDTFTSLGNAATSAFGKMGQSLVGLRNMFLGRNVKSNLTNIGSNPAMQVRSPGASISTTWGDLMGGISADKATRKAKKDQENAENSAQKLQRQLARENEREANKLKKESNSKKKQDDAIALNEAQAHNKEINLKNSNNPVTILKGILNYTKNIFKEIQGNMNGLGYNLAYVRNMLIKQYGPLMDDLLPKTDKTKYGKPRGLIHRTLSAVIGGPLGWLKEKGEDLSDWVREKFITLMNPINLIIKGFQAVWGGIKQVGETLGKIASGAWELFLAIGPALLQMGATVITTISKTAVLAGKVIFEGLSTGLSVLKGVFIGFGETLGRIGGSLIDTTMRLGGLLASVSTLLVDLTTAVLPEVLKSLWKLVSGIGGFLISLPIKLVAGIGKMVTSKFQFGTFSMRIEGGYLDEIKNIGSGVIKHGMNSLESVPIINGMAMRSPKRALPVFIAGIDALIRSGKSLFGNDENSTTAPKAADVSTTSAYVKTEVKRAKIASAPLTEKLNEIINIMSGGSIMTPSGISMPTSVLQDGGNLKNQHAINALNKYKTGYKSSRDKLKNTSDPIKLLVQDIGSVDDLMAKESVATSINMVATEAAVDTSKAMKLMVHGDKSTKGMGLMRLLQSLLLGPLGWLLSTAKSILTGNWGQILENSMRRGILSKFLNPILENFWRKSGGKVFEAMDKVLFNPIKKWLKGNFTDWFDFKFKPGMTMAIDGLKSAGDKIGRFFGKESAEAVATKVARDGLGGGLATKGGRVVSTKVAKSLMDRFSKGKYTHEAIGALTDKDLYRKMMNIVGETGLDKFGHIGGGALAPTVIAKSMMGTFKNQLGETSIQAAEKTALKMAGNLTSEMGYQVGKHGAENISASLAKNVLAKTTQASIPQKVINFIQQVLNSKNLKKLVGEKGAKMLSKLGGFFGKLTKKLATTVMSDKILAKIAMRIGGGPANIAFCVYDFTSGMSEAHNIFKLSPGTEVDLKLKLAAGMGKMISGAILFGLIPDNWIASAIYEFIADDTEKAAMASGQAKLEKEWLAFKEISGEDISFDDFNNKVVNKRFMTKVGDTFRGVGSAIGGAASWVGGALGAFGTFFTKTVLPGIGNYLKETFLSPFKDVFNLFADLKLFFTDGWQVGLKQLFANSLTVMFDIVSLAFRPILMLIKTPFDWLAQKLGWKTKDESLGDMTVNGLAKGSKAILNGIQTTSSTTPAYATLKTNKQILNSNKYGGKPATHERYGRGGINPSDEPSKQLSGIYHFLQGDSRWANNSYGPRDTMKTAGCAPSIAASLISNYNQKRIVTPVEAAKFAVENGFKLKNNGTDHKFFQAIGAKYGLKIIPGIKTASAVLEQLRAKRPVLVMGRKLSADSPFNSTEVHYMLLVSYDENLKQAVVLDPLSNDLKYCGIDTILRDSSMVFFTATNGGTGMLAKYVSKNGAQASLTELGSVRAGSVGPISATHEGFISKILGGALSGFQKYGVLPSLTIAQAILESGFGKNSIGNNVFGIKAGKTWAGLKQLVGTNEFINGIKTPIKAFFRDYNSVDDSVADHAKLLSNKRYDGVRSAKDYRSAAVAISKAGYATDPKYSSKLISIIERYGLNKYDKQTQWGKGVELSSNLSETYNDQRYEQKLQIAALGEALAGKRIDGIPYFYQKDKKWANISYDINGGKENIGSKGCAATTLASISSAYNSPTTPSAISKFAHNIGAIEKSGTNDRLFSEWANKHGFTASSVSKGHKLASTENITGSLMSRKPIILMGKKGGADSPFKSGTAHYLIASSFNDKTGMVRVIDSAYPSNSPIEYPLQAILRDTSRYTFTTQGMNGILGYDPVKIRANAAGKSNDPILSANRKVTSQFDAMRSSSLSGFGNEVSGMSTTPSTGSTGYDALMDSMGIIFSAAVGSRFSSTGTIGKGFGQLLLDKVMQTKNNPDGSTAPISYTGTAIMGNGSEGIRITSAELKKATKENPILPIGRFSQGFNPSATDRSFITGDTDVQQFFGQKLLAFARDGLKRGINLSDGSRARSEQQILFDKYGSGRAASPWKMSNHYTGLAADVDSMENVPEALLNKFGLYRPFLKGGNGTKNAEPWHIEPMETKGFDARKLEEKYGSVIDWGKGLGAGYNSSNTDFLNKVNSDNSWNYDSAARGNGLASYELNGAGQIAAANSIVRANIAAKKDLANANLMHSVDRVQQTVAAAVSSNDQDLVIQALMEQTRVLVEMSNTLKDIRQDLQTTTRITPANTSSYEAAKKANHANMSSRKSTIPSGKGGDLIDRIIKK